MMIKQTLNGAWSLTLLQSGQTCAAKVPGSVYADLMQAGLMEDPFYGDHEMGAFEMMKGDFSYQKSLPVTDALLESDAVVLQCEGIDTVADVFVNSALVGHCENMHRTFEFDVKAFLVKGDNKICIKIDSPLKAIETRNAEYPLLGSLDGIQGFSHIRKAHCMFGWDWGPRLPDAGIWRNIRLLGINIARLNGVAVTQMHAQDKVVLQFAPDITFTNTEDAAVRCEFTVTAPNGTLLCQNAPISALEIEQFELWWPNGYGAQPLYEVLAVLKTDTAELDRFSCRIGLRTMALCREKDEYGESFCHEVNGVRIFAMGADYIPEDNILSRVTPARTHRLLQMCQQSNFNCIRVWGGGYYPDSCFYDSCDELGLLVWQDFMFACAAYRLTPEVTQNIVAEVRDNVTRFRNHACLALWCGNNEMEWFTTQGRYVNTDALKKDYLMLFETVIPNALRACDTQTVYWPASPSSGGQLDNPNDENRGDAHYWDVWHENMPFSDYRKHFFRYVSEFGFQSFPCKKTIDAFALPEEQNVFSYMMEKHQRNGSANGKIVTYISRTYLYPNSLAMLIYASQLLQAEAIQYGVQHWRRNRGRCMGALYWQLNDCWPVASWASVDYFGRWKALQYYAKRFFAPIAVSCREEGFSTQLDHINVQPLSLEQIVCKAELYLHNESLQPFTGSLHWQIRDESAVVITGSEMSVYGKPLSSTLLFEVPCEGVREHINNRYLAYQLYDALGNAVSQGTSLFSLPKYFKFQDPSLQVTVNGADIIVTAKAYAKSVELYSDSEDFVLSDNFFDMNAGTVQLRVLEGTCCEIKARSVFEIR